MSSLPANKNHIHIPHNSVARPQHVFLILIAFRLFNALTLRTFFQPDEYYQSLEPAWQLAFGPDSGAWLTWVSSDFPWDMAAEVALT
jgi:phosphatidylinositol glycan class B